MTLTSIKNDQSSLARKAEEQIVQYIRENQMQPGDRMPIEKELEMKLNVSRSTIRAAMNSLKTRGIVDIRQGSGTYIAQTVGVADDPLGLFFKYDQKKALKDLLELRLMLEPAIAGYSAQRASDEDIQEILQLADKVEQLINRGEDYTEYDTEFHRRIAESTGNELFMVLVPEIARGVKLFVMATHGRISKETIETHRKLAEAIRARDAKAAENAMLQHLKYNQQIIESDG